MPGHLLRQRGPKNFQAGDLRPVHRPQGAKLSDLAEPPKCLGVQPGVNQVIPVVHPTAAVAQPFQEPPKADPVGTPETPSQEIFPEAETKNEEDFSDVEEEVKEVPKKPRKKTEKEQELIARFSAKPEVVAAPKRTRSQKKVVQPVEEDEDDEHEYVQQVVVVKKKKAAVKDPDKPKRAPTAWHLFMKEAKEFPEVKACPGKERTTLISKLYQERKAKLAAGAPAAEETE